MEKEVLEVQPDGCDALEISIWCGALRSGRGLGFFEACPDDVIEPLKSHSSTPGLMRSCAQASVLATVKDLGVGLTDVREDR